MSKNGTLADDVIDDGDTAWMLASTALVMLMVPGLGFFYSGMARSKNALSLVLLAMLSLAVVSVQWWLWGYSLTFSLSGGVFIGDFRHIAFRDVNETRASVFEHIPSVVFAIFQCMFAAVTPALVIGSSAERARILPSAVFIFVWATLVYDPIARWTWSPAGWSYREGVLDFAGGTPVHIASGAAALAHSIMVGRRITQESEDFKPHNIANTVLGTTMLWFGWFGFNGGSAFGANARAGMAIFVTNLSASIGGMTWMIMDYRLTRKLSAVSFCSGAIAGLVCITPGSGFVGPASAVLYGVSAGVCCNFAVKLKYLLRFDDALDVFAVHAVGGFLGNLLTGIFAESKWAELNDTQIPGGWIDGNPSQLLTQLYGSFAGLGYSFTVTTLILFAMSKIPGLNLRASSESEIKGMDDSDMGEFAYYHIERLVASSDDGRPVSEERLNRQSRSSSSMVMA